MLLLLVVMVVVVVELMILITSFHDRMGKRIMISLCEGFYYERRRERERS